MKNFFKLLGIIALVAVIGFSIVACDDGVNDDNSGSSNPFIGTWRNTDGGLQETVTFTDTSYNWQLMDNSGVLGTASGIYNRNGNVATFSVQSGSNSMIYTATVSGNTLSMDGRIFNKI